jgi:hypothetical protein
MFAGTYPSEETKSDTSKISHPQGGIPDNDVRTA